MCVLDVLSLIGGTIAIEVIALHAEVDQSAATMRHHPLQYFLLVLQLELLSQHATAESLRSQHQVAEVENWSREVSCRW